LGYPLQHPGVVTFRQDEGITGSGRFTELTNSPIVGCVVDFLVPAGVRFLVVFAASIIVASWRQTHMYSKIQAHIAFTAEQFDLRGDPLMLT
jgi:hypothetical protein